MTLTFRKRLSARIKDKANAYRAWRNNYKVGTGTRIKSSVSIKSGKTGKIVIGNNCSIYDHVFFRAGGGSITLGDYVSINPFTTLDGQGTLTIGNHVRIASHCAIVTSNHVFEDRNAPIRTQGLTRKGVVIEDDVWIGTHSTVLDGVRIAKGCVIGAGSVVTKSTEPFGVYVGAPAKRIKDR
ncbi:acyltransferase [Mesorhizobium sp. SB112]|uniref:acyltransferase n=1 Tax=Mesorhizobium sp. SB112 TaxID=3151853 RepID=UPI003264D16A